MVPKTTTNQASLWMQSIAMGMRRSDWEANPSKYCSFDNKDVPNYTAEEIFDELIDLTDGKKLLRRMCSVEGTRATAQYELVKEVQLVPRPKKKRAAKKKAVKKED